MRALSPTRTTGPAESIISLAAAKAHLRVDSSDDDDLITSLISAAEGYLDGYAGVLGRALVTQTWQQEFNDFPCCNEIRLPLGELQSVSFVDYFDEANSSQSFTDFTAHSDAKGPKIVLDSDASWPGTYERPDAVTITWVCGYGDAADVPVPIIQAAKLLVGNWYAHREAVSIGSGTNVISEIPFAVSALLAPFRRTWI